MLLSQVQCHGNFYNVYVIVLFTQHLQNKLSFESHFYHSCARQDTQHRFIRNQFDENYMVKVCYGNQNIVFLFSFSSSSACFSFKCKRLKQKQSTKVEQNRATQRQNNHSNKLWFSYFSSVAPKSNTLNYTFAKAQKQNEIHWRSTNARIK